MNRQRMDVTIVGGGMVGMAQAALLAVRYPQLRISLLEASPVEPRVSPDGYDARVVALTEASRALLEEVGAWQHIAGQRECPYTQMRVWDAEGTGSVYFDCRDVKLPNLGHIVENNVVLAALRARIDELSNVELVTGFKLESWWRDCGLWHLQSRSPERDAVEGLDNQSPVFTTRLLIGADGARSRVRDM
ncbi:MAG TPA: 2-octaprenyl-3-methyl-6-methoxy-1,4-benzoquinol hydroxylase, partial [Microbulbifer sp.]